jgi:hypothetical protein
MGEGRVQCGDAIITDESSLVYFRAKPFRLGKATPVPNKHAVKNVLKLPVLGWGVDSTDAG